MATKKKTKRKDSRAAEPQDINQWFNFAKDSYLERTRRPVYALLFLVPFIVVYELGTLFINTDKLYQTQERVVAFVWLQDFLHYLGTGPRFAWAAPPLIVVVILLALQVASRKKWDFRLLDAAPMAVECILLAVPLIVFSLFLNSSSQPADAYGYDVCGAGGVVECSSTVTLGGQLACWAVAATGGSSFMADIVTGIGAGIYEELVFRLILICLLMLICQDILRLPYKNSIVFSVIISAALFSLHHHIIFVNGQLALVDQFDLVKFSFRTIAGVYFAVLYAVRGFGIAAGTHAFYDIIATILNSLVFTQ